MKQIVKENDDWIIQKDDENRVITISYFEDLHYKDEISIPYDELSFVK